MSGDTFNFFPCSYESARSQGCFRAVCVRVVDGDTYDFIIDLGVTARIKLRIRLNGLNTPEFFHPENAAELEHAKEAMAFMADLILDKPCLVRTFRSKTGSDVKTIDRYVGDVLSHLGGNDWQDVKLPMRKAGLEKRASYA